ncbi:MAG: hypothetical protein HY513_00630 [Candidatus Aenigmarchaeota archaeon]|nr:hypothetical protein [Candidatus Aenigmarchaeota archaeon]
MNKTDFLPSLFGQGNWMAAVLSGRKPIAYSSAIGYLKAERIARDTNGIPVMACPELYEFARLNHADIFYADQASWPEFEAKSENRYMQEWAEVSGREFLGTP